MKKEIQESIPADEEFTLDDMLSASKKFNPGMYNEILPIVLAAREAGFTDEEQKACLLAIAKDLANK
ncbi:MAG: hypothetical protein HC836_25840 [Richelia sp. RM2_1_2]|nr:hypothetical protein [Richelia sp. RM2_1_2]